MVPAKTGSPRHFPLGYALSRHRGFVDLALAFNDVAVGRHTVARPHKDDGAERKTFSRYFTDLAIDFDQGGLGHQVGQTLMLLRARPAATPSSISPTRNRRTTAAASSAAPMKTAPTAAIVISISIENGVPYRAAVIARQPTGIRPTARAIRKAARSMDGKREPKT